MESIHIKTTHYTLWALADGGDCQFTVKRTDAGYKGKLDLFDPIRNLEELQRQGLVPKPMKKITDKKLTHFIMNHREVKDNLPIENEKIERLMQAIQSEPIPKLDTGQFGLSKQWLKENARVAMEERLKHLSTDDFPNLETEKEKLYPQLLDLKHLAEYYEGGWTDDNPKIEITIRLSDGNTLQVNSKSQHAYMIPWKIEDQSQTVKTFNIHIAKALNKIIPSQCQAYERIAPDIRELFFTRVWYEPIINFEDNLHQKKKLNDLGDQILPVTQQYNIVQSRIYGECCGKTEIEEWTVKLQDKAGPKNFFIELEAPIKKGKLDLTQYSPEKIKQFRDQIDSIPWLKTFMEKHPEYEYSININQGCSISKKRYQYFRKYYGWPVLDKPYSSDIVSFEAELDERYNNSHWLIFPDKNMVLISYTGNPILKWKREDIDPDLTDSGYKGGLTISPEGEILHY